MDVKKLLGDKFVEGMSDKEILEALSELDEPKPQPTGNVIDKSVFDKTASELAKLKKEYQALSEQILTDEQRQQKELDDAKEAKNKYERALLRLNGTKRLMDGGITDSKFVDDLFEKATFKSEEEMNGVIDNVIALSGVLISSTEKRVRAEILQNTPTPPNKGKVDEEDVKKMSLTEQMNLKFADPTSYEKLFGGKS